jgi:hypothetical protein
MRRRCLISIVFLLAFLVGSLRAAVSPELREALDSFRTEGPKGWAFTQSTASAEKSRVEKFDPLQDFFLKWTLVAENGVPPTVSELNTYRQEHSRRSGGNTAPNVKEQMDYDSAELVSDDGTESAWFFRLKPGADDDSSAEHMAVKLWFHQPTNTISRIELHSLEPFSPVLAVKIELARTVIEYSIPTAETPSLLQSISVKVRGRAFYFKSLDSDLTVSYSDYRYAGKR